MLSDLPVPTDPRVLVDYRNADDAGVFVVGDVALVQTVDFFTPIVDDPFAYGRIAAANAVSDVYAMGARPITALAIAAFPAKDFAAETVKAIFAGGLSVLQECGVALLGGHTVQDTEVKFGYAVTGLVSPDAVWTNAGARVGDVLVLTKPLGTGHHRHRREVRSHRRGARWPAPSRRCSGPTGPRPRPCWRCRAPCMGAPTSRASGWPGTPARWPRPAA